MFGVYPSGNSGDTVTVVPSTTAWDINGAGVGILLLIAVTSWIALVFNDDCKDVFVDTAEFTILVKDVVLIAFIADVFVVFCATTGERLWFNCVMVAFAESTAAWIVPVFGSTYGVNAEPWPICPENPVPEFVSVICVIAPL